MEQMRRFSCSVKRGKLMQQAQAVTEQIVDTTFKVNLVEIT